MAKIKDNTKVITNKVRLSYASIWVPKSINGSDPKYSCSILIPKNDTETVNCINTAIDNAIKAGVGKFGGKVPARAALKLPLRDGDAERPDDEAYKGMYFVNANSKDEPGILDENGHKYAQPAPDKVYSGCWVKASITFYAFNTSGNRGVACGLNNLMKVEDGENLTGHSSAQSDFDVEGDDDDFLA